VNVTRSTSRAEPHWTRYDASVRPQALILMLHGGKDRSQDAVDSRSLSWRRSASMQRDIARRAQEAGASVWLLRFTRRGWNGVAETAEFRDMGPLGHYLLRGRRAWNAFAIESSLRVLQAR
jgi:hypothetical protein